MSCHIKQEKILFFCSQHSFFSQILGQSFTHVLKNIEEIFQKQSIIWYWILWKVTSHSDSLPLIDILISRDSRFHHSDTLSMFELSLELCRRSLSCVLRIRQEVHLHKARHFWPIPFCSRDSCGAYQLALIQSDHAGQVQSKCNLKNICICNRLKDIHIECSKQLKWNLYFKCLDRAGRFGQC